MAVDAHRGRGGIFGSTRTCTRELWQDGRRAALLGCVCAGTLLVAVSAPAAAQQTVIIGGGPVFVGRGGSGVVINNEVLESLGPAAPALPYVAPISPGGALPAMPVGPGIAYRQPDTGQLMVTRPGTLLFPPPVFPKSRLTFQTPGRGLAQAPDAAPEPELQSRLLVPPPPRAQPGAASQAAEAPPPMLEPAPVEPVIESPVAAAEPPPMPAPAPQAVPEPEPAPEPTPEPEPRVAVQPTPEPEPLPEPLPEPMPEPAPEPEPRVAARPAPSEPAGAPAPSPLIQELTEKPAPAPAAPAAPAQAPEAEAEPPPSPEPLAETVVRPAAAPSPEPPATAEPEPEPPPPPTEALMEKPAAEIQTAALPPASALGKQVRVLFREGSAELSDDAKGELVNVARFLEANASVRIQLLAYAKGTADSSSRARRLSLSRALAVRAFLIEKGVRSTRMDVRALGDKAPDGPIDRVDIMPLAANQ